jgi:hypothetical protein
MLIKIKRGRWLFPRLYNTNGDYRSGDSRHHPWPGSRGPSRRTPPLAPVDGLVVEAPVVALPRWLLLLPSLHLFPHQRGPRHRPSIACCLLSRSVELLARERTRRLAPDLRRRLHTFMSHLLYIVRSTIVSTLHRLGPTICLGFPAACFLCVFQQRAWLHLFRMSTPVRSPHMERRVSKGVSRRGRLRIRKKALKQRAGILPRLW